MSAVRGALLGMIFGIGLALGGMTQPNTVLAFLDFFGHWDPSLAFVMGGAIAVYAPLYRLVIRAKPIYVQEFVVFANQRVDTPLLLGAALFGVGWGLSGVCPGPAVVSAGTGSEAGVVFALSMIAGMVAHAQAPQRLRTSRS